MSVIDWAEAFLKSLEETGVINRACEAVPVSKVSVWRRRNSDPEFATRFEESLKVGALLLEQEAVRRARDGTLKKMFTKGGAAIIDPATGEQYTEHVYSDNLLLALLRRHYPEYYKPEKGGDVTVSTTVVAMTSQQLNELQSRIRAADTEAQKLLGQ